MTRLLTLRLEENNFEGEISGLDLRNLREFNVSGNPRLTGTVPESLERFPVSAFEGNLGLCGGPLRECDATAVRQDPVRPRSGVIALPVNDPARPGVVSSSSSVGSSGGTGGARMSLVWIVAIIVADVVILVLISLMLYWYFWRRSHKGKENEGKRGRGSELMMAAEKMVYSSSPYTNEGMTRGTTGFERGRMVFFEENGRRFELEDLLRASAEMLGKGGFGTAYKALLDDGFVVAVKRMKEAQGLGGGGRREFEQQMEVLGRLRHQNVVALKAYYFARDEKLLVFDYMPNGSLFWLLHGNRGPGRTPLDWTTRLKIAAGAARGIAFLHNSTKSPKLIHGNIKSSNILIDKAGNARVSDFGLSSFVPATANTKNNGYRAPETLDGRKLTQRKCPSSLDGGGPYGVAVSGVIDLPRWVQSVVREEWTGEVFDLELMRYKDIEEEMVGLLQIAMACAAPSPDQRPKMSQVVKLIDEIRGAEVSPSHENTTFDSDSPSVSEDTCGVSQ
ncbi:putative leucine-rich repeat receptor-like protein [Drosera capensis]